MQRRHIATVPVTSMATDGRLQDGPSQTLPGGAVDPLFVGYFLHEYACLSWLEYPEGEERYRQLLHTSRIT